MKTHYSGWIKIPRNHRGFTLVKLAVVIAFANMALAALLVPTTKAIYPRLCAIPWGFPIGIFTVGAILSILPFLYVYLVKKSVFFKEQVVSGVTHEFKSPLFSIRCATQLLQQEMQGLTGAGHFESAQGRIADYLLMIRDNSQRLENFVQDLLEVARIDHGELALSIKKVDLDEVCQKLLRLYRPLAEQKHVTLEFTSLGAETVHCDPEKIQIVISNLLSNAVKFTDHGKIRLKIETKNKEARVSVQDTGVGIHPEDLPHIFDKFYMGKNNNLKGSGLGLAIVKGWVAAHGGMVKADSGGVNQGTRVSFTLPVYHHDMNGVIDSLSKLRCVF